VTAIAVSLILISCPLIGNSAANAASPVPPFTIDSKGWIHFTNTLVNSLGLINPTTLTLNGKLSSDGACVFSSAKYFVKNGQSGYSEETAFNPSTCQETVVAGGLTPAGQAILNSNTMTGASQASPNSSTLGSSVITPAITTAYADFEKVSYVDPLDITITSLVSNLNWQSNGTAITGVVATPESYNFNWDGWSNSPIGTTLSGYPTWPGFTAAQYSQTFNNTDFEAVIVALYGEAGYALCGFNSNPATFYLSPFVEGNAQGYYSYSNSNSVSGGCSDLVHFRENHGPGFSS